MSVNPFNRVGFANAMAGSTRLTQSRCVALCVNRRGTAVMARQAGCRLRQHGGPIITRRGNGLQIAVQRKRLRTIYMASLAIAKITHILDLAVVMQAAAVTVNHVTILQFRATMDLVDHVAEIDGLRWLFAFRPDCYIGCPRLVTGLAVANGVVPVVSMQAQVGK